MSSSTLSNTDSGTFTLSCNNNSSSLRSNLMTFYKSSVNSTTTVTTNNPNRKAKDTSTNIPFHTNPNKNKNSSSSSFILRNPQTLISHEPNQLSESLHLSLDQIISLRNQVSNAIVTDSIVGNCIHVRNDNGNDDEDEVIEEENENDDNNQKNQRNLKMRKKDNQLIVSSMTAKDLFQSCTNSTTIMMMSNQPLVLPTGSHELDKFVSSSSSKIITISSKRKRKHNELNNNNLHNSNTGIQIGTITEICGLSSSGKTQLVLSIAANTIITHYLQPTSHNNFNHDHDHFSYPKFKVYYIATGGGNTSLLSLAKRFRQLCKEKLPQNSNTSNGDAILNQIIFTSVNNNPYYLLTELTKIEHDFVTNQRRNGNILVIIDSISGCLSSYLYSDGDGGIGAGLMNEISLALRRMSRLKVAVKNTCNGNSSVNQCAVLITNSMVMDGNSNHYNNSNINSNTKARMHKPALGESWRAADVRLIIERFQNVYDDDDEYNITRNERNMTSTVKGLKLSTKMIVIARLDKHFTKSSRSFSNMVVQFAINGSGVVDVNY